MKYERLTDKENLFWALKAQPLSAEVGIFLTDCLNRLAELEDKIEQGTLIELACKVGDTVYDISSGKILDCSVEKIEYIFTERKSMYITILLNYPTYTAVEEIEIYDIGRTVFLTHEEAEKRLKELQNG